MADITKALGTDILFRKDFVQVSPEIGDISVISGIENFKQAMIHRIITTPGALAHRPDYGVGLKFWQNAQPNIEAKRALAQRINSQLLRDPRCQEVTSVQIESTDAEPFKQLILVQVKAVGYDEEVKLAIPFGGI